VGHIVNPQREYRLLRRQLDRTVAGAPDSPILMQILSILFSPEDARVARRLPGRLARLEELSRRLDIPEPELLDRLGAMAERGLVVDLEHEGHRWFALPPVVIGLFEFAFMRTRDEVPQAELARLFEEYSSRDSRFAQSLFQGQTQVARTLVREDALPEDDHTEILDWERAGELIRSATAAGVSLCACRHKASHLGTACDAPQRVCLSLNFAAESLVRNGMAEPLTTAEAVKILEGCQEAGLAQSGDNVQHRVSFICNCCGCCCEIMRAMKRFDLRGAIVTSNWIMEVDLSKCTGCGKCVAACPVDAIELGQNPTGKAVRDEKLCLGCGVCYSACQAGAISMKPRRRRVFTPENVFDRVALMAIERGKLAGLIFDDPKRFSHRALGRLIALLERANVLKAAMAIRPLRSVFLRRVITEGKKQLGPIAEILD